MRTVKNLVAASLCTMGFASCAHYTADAPLMGIANNSINTYVKADLDYSGAKKVSANVKSKNLLGILTLTQNGDKLLTNPNRYKSLTMLQRKALYRAKVNNNVDIIMEPEFTTERHSYFFGLYRTTNVMMSGWGVNMKGIKEDSNPNCISTFNSTILPF